MAGRPRNRTAAAPGGTYLQTIQPADILGTVTYGATAAADVKDGYSLGYLGDSSGELPATGGKTGTDALIWSQAYNASSQWQVTSDPAAHALGRLRMAQDVSRRTASVAVRANGTITVEMHEAGLYQTAWIDSAANLGELEYGFVAATDKDLAAARAAAAPAGVVADEEIDALEGEMP